MNSSLRHLFLVVILLSGWSESYAWEENTDITFPQGTARGWAFSYISPMELYDSTSVTAHVKERGFISNYSSKSCIHTPGIETSCFKYAVDTTVTPGDQYCGYAIVWAWLGSNGEQRTKEECTNAPYPPVGSTSIYSVNFLGCHQPGCALWRFEFHASNATSYRIERKSATGSWQLAAETTTGVYVPHLAGNPLSWRIRGENPTDNGSWSPAFYTTGKCNGGGPGGPGPID